MNTYTPEQLHAIGSAIFRHLGAPESDVKIVMDHLVEASLMGHESHGITRIGQYSEHIERGLLQPGKQIQIVREQGGAVTVDGQMNFGQVCAHRMCEIAIEKARAHGIAIVVNQRGHHMGRIGAWTCKVADAGMFAMAFVASPKPGHWVVPWGGREGRLSTNPISWAAPAEGRPIFADLSTSAIAEGQIYAAREAGKPLPENCVLDGAGRPTTDAAAFYGEGRERIHPSGAILPFGGRFGHRGYALSLLVMLLGNALTGEELVSELRYINDMTLIVVDPEAFGGAQAFRGNVQEIVEYMKSAAPAVEGEEVLVPGEPEYRRLDERLKTGIPLPDKTWNELQELAERLGLATVTD